MIWSNKSPLQVDWTRSMQIYSWMVISNHGASTNSRQLPINPGYYQELSVVYPGKQWLIMPAVPLIFSVWHIRIPIPLTPDV